MMDIGPGTRVECVDAEPRRHGGTGVLKKGNIYTVLKLAADPYGSDDPCVHLYEIKRRVHPLLLCRIPYLLSRFRPIRDTTTDTGMAMLRKAVKDAIATNKVDA